MYKIVELHLRRIFAKNLYVNLVTRSIVIQEE